MAFMNQEKKAKIAAQLKTIIPKSWKWSLGVRHHSTIVLTVAGAPVDLLAGAKWYDNRPERHLTLHRNRAASHFAGETLALIERIFEALNIDNFDDSDISTDYFHVGHYVDFRIGAWDKPFVVLPFLASAAA